MDEHKRKWLNSLGLADAKSVKDCDMFARTVLMDDGRTRQMCECYTRVMGYHRPTTSFNRGKQSEHRERQFFTETSTLRTPA